MKELNLRKERIKNGWTLEYVAKQLSLTNQAVSNLETGKSRPSYDVLVKLENLFNLSHRQLFTVIDEDTNSLFKK